MTVSVIGMAYVNEGIRCQLEFGVPRHMHHTADHIAL